LNGFGHGGMCFGIRIAVSVFKNNLKQIT